MSTERSPLNPRSLLAGPAQYDSEFSSSADEDASTHVRIPRRTVYCLIGYVILASILALACLLALLLSHTGNQHPTYHWPPPTPLPMPSDPSSPSMHGPLPARRDWNQSHLGHFLVLADIHLEPHYNAAAPNADLAVCRDDQHMDVCKRADWEMASPHRPAVVAGSDSYRFGRYMCDPPHSLVSAALRSLATTLTAVQLDVILLPGDLAAHFIACPRTLYGAINRTIELVTTTFPSTPVIFAIGNTDTHPTSALPLTQSEPELAAAVTAQRHARGGCRTVFSDLLGLLLLHGVLDERVDSEAVHTFCHGGYYSKPLNHARIRIVSLNTIVWSHQLHDTITQVLNNPSATIPPSPPIPCNQRPDDPRGQLAWLEQQVRLADGQGQSVWLVGHVPPGMKAGEQGWCWQYWQRVEQLLQRYESVITQLHFGDYSQDMIRIVPRSNTATPQRSVQQHDRRSPSSAVSAVSHVMHINPGLSPRKNVNPAARVYTYDLHSSHVIDYQQLYIDLIRTHTTPTTPHPQPPHWLFQYSALDAYGLGRYSAASWLGAVRRMRWGGGASGDGGVLLERYVRGVNVWKAGVGDGVDYLCDVMVVGLGDNRRCKRTGVVPGLEEELQDEELGEQDGDD